MTTDMTTVKRYYKKAEISAEQRRAMILDKINSREEITVLALCHIEQNINLYRYEYKDSISSERNDKISVNIIDKFPGCDSIAISKKLSKLGLLKTKEYFLRIFTISLIFFMPLNLLFYFTLSLEQFFGILFILSFCHCIFLLYMMGTYTISSKIKCYNNDLSKDKP